MVGLVRMFACKFATKLWKNRNGTKGSHLGSIFQKTPNCFSVPPHSIESNSQQWRIRILCRLLAKQFLKSILQKAFPHEWFKKTRSLRKNRQPLQKIWISLFSALWWCAAKNHFRSHDFEDHPIYPNNCGVWY